MSFSVFQFHNFQNLNDFRRNLNANLETLRHVREWAEDDALRSLIIESPEFNFNEHETIQIEGSTIQYLFFEGYTERPRKSRYWRWPSGEMKDKEERINAYQANLLVFELDQELYGIVFAGINRAKAILKDCFPAETWGNVLPVNHQVTEDVLYWIFKRFIDTPGESLSSTRQVIVTALESYMGKTRDNVNAMRGEGSRISTILGTLAFLFNNEELKAIRPAVQYGNEKVLIEVGLTGTLKTWSNSYRGQSFRNLTGQRKENALAIFIFLKIIPALIECYNEHRENDEWSPQLKVDFLRRLGTMIMTEVGLVLAKIERENTQDDDEIDADIEDDEDFDLDIDDDDEIEE